ncbi:GNAT family N-acetyltransferase [Ruegeria sediminis]|uniref:GNAT family N-acetyltransferase n=1 Tax=Ruegeria sediminis TaxID=2583820 RepID=A0ABY2WTD5_9RHOB|nr:GNAT family N-acetyltransferase [Ruegeria sediminis]TMV04783.1 GNAT family N-acetyltransferase [Ruegeria sediminis]
MISRLEQAELAGALEDLTGILHGCVHAGASVGFILPYDASEARAYWRDRVYPAVAANGTDLFAAHDGGRIRGTVQLAMAAMPNQPHRADVAKLLVHPDARRRGLGRALMQALEARARDLRRTLLVLDTRSFDPSRQLYESLGYEVAGEIPQYCRNPFEDRYEPTTYMYKVLA